MPTIGVLVRVNTRRKQNDTGIVQMPARRQGDRGTPARRFQAPSCNGCRLHSMEEKRNPRATPEARNLLPPNVPRTHASTKHRQPTELAPRAWVRSFQENGSWFRPIHFEFPTLWQNRGNTAWSELQVRVCRARPRRALAWLALRVIRPMPILLRLSSLELDSMSCRFLGPWRNSYAWCQSVPATSAQELVSHVWGDRCLLGALAPFGVSARYGW